MKRKLQEEDNSVGSASSFSPSLPSSLSSLSSSSSDEDVEEGQCRVTLQPLLAALGSSSSPVGPSITNKNQGTNSSEFLPLSASRDEELVCNSTVGGENSAGIFEIPNSSATASNIRKRKGEFLDDHDHISDYEDSLEDVIDEELKQWRLPESPAGKKTMTTATHVQKSPPKSPSPTSITALIDPTGSSSHAAKEDVKTGGPVKTVTFATTSATSKTSNAAPYEDKRNSNDQLSPSALETKTNKSDVLNDIDRGELECYLESTKLEAETLLRRYAQAQVQFFWSMDQRSLPLFEEQVPRFHDMWTVCAPIHKSLSELQLFHQDIVDHLKKQTEQQHQQEKHKGKS